MSRFARLLAALVVAVLIPSAAFAQATITGIVTDTSGAILPGVTVEAASPALIEKVRSVVTDGNGQYRIVDLRPGAYTVTFTLAGFSTVRREGINLTGSFTASVDVQLRVGALEETITVTGEAPIIDVQSTTRQRVISTETIEALPTGRLLANLGVLVPGVSATAPGGATSGSFQDVGGSTGDQMTNLVAHGSRADNARITTNGINSNAFSGYMGGRSPNPAAIQEVTIDTGGASAEQGQGGPRMNMIPREGGNEFKGTFFGSFANSAMQGANLSQELIARGLPSPNQVEEIWDINPGFGGPIAKDRLWFYSTVRRFRSDNYVGAGVFHDKNANNPAAWSYDPDLSRPAVSENMWWDAQARITWQASSQHKFAISSDVQKRFGYRWISGNINAPEANTTFAFPQETAHGADWTAPLTSRLLLEAGAFWAKEGFRSRMNPLYTNEAALISVTEQSTGRIYRKPATFGENYNAVFYTRLALSYVTGTHAFKVGYNDGTGEQLNQTFLTGAPVTYRFNNGVPNQLTQYAAPFAVHNKLDHDLGLFVQDKWTIDRLTVNMGLRFDYRANHFPEQHLGTGVLTPGRDLTLAAVDNESLKDITPKLGMAYDAFGNGRTAIKVSINKYLQGTPGNFGANPASSVVNSTSRSWTDSNGDRIPDCDLRNTAANGECAAMANSNFGNAVVGSVIDQAALTGWGNRNYNWEFSAGVQQQLLPRLSADVSYYRRWYGNFLVTDNRAVTAADYTSFSLTAPVNPLLPGGGGYTITGYQDLNPNKFGVPADNILTLSKNYGAQSETYNGVDVSFNARMQGGLLFQGGFSTGKRVMDNCEVAAKLPEMMVNPTTLTYGALGGQLPLEYCHQETGLETQVKLLSVYTLPKIDLQVSATYQSLPGQMVFANYNAPNAVVAPSLGRNLSGNAPNTVLSLIDPGSMYGDRINQLDMRFGKILRFGRVRSSLNLDLYNVLNVNPVLVESAAYAAFRRPQQILMARFAKVGATFDF